MGDSYKKTKGGVGGTLISLKKSDHTGGGGRAILPQTLLFFVGQFGQIYETKESSPKLSYNQVHPMNIVLFNDACSSLDWS